MKRPKRTKRESKDELLMFGLRAKLFISSIRWILFLNVLLFLVACVFIHFQDIVQSASSFSATTIGVIGTLVGAFVGGFFTLVGSFYANTLQQRSSQNIRKKNTIYNPLYDELVSNLKIITEDNKYPTLVEFEVGPQTMCPHPQFSAWQRICSDNRKLSVPKILDNSMNELYLRINNYLKVRNLASVATRKIIKSVLAENNCSAKPFANVGEAVSDKLLDGKRISKTNCIITDKNADTIDDALWDRISARVSELAESNDDINKVRQSYAEWVEAQKYAIEVLSLLIKQAQQRYEG